MLEAKECRLGNTGFINRSYVGPDAQQDMHGVEFLGAPFTVADAIGGRTFALSSRLRFDYPVRSIASESRSRNFLSSRKRSITREWANIRTRFT